MEPIQKGLEQSFESERLTRWIRDCQEIEELREAALALVQQLDQQKSARAWLAARASDSENAKLNMLAELIKRMEESDRRLKELTDQHIADTRKALDELERLAIDD